jgi:hypothetical protein
MHGHQENSGNHWNFLKHYLYKISSSKIGGIMCGAKVNFGLIWEPICNKVLPFVDTVSKEESLHLKWDMGRKFCLELEPNLEPHSFGDMVEISR